MAFVTLRIPDEVYEEYKKMHSQNPQHIMEKQLARFSKVDAHERAIIIIKEARQAIEKLFGKPIEDTAAMAKWIEGLISLKIDGLEFTLKAGQRKKLEGLANFYHKDLKEYVQMHLERILDKELGNF